MLMARYRRRGFDAISAQSLNHAAPNVLAGGHEVLGCSLIDGGRQ